MPEDRTKPPPGYNLLEAHDEDGEVWLADIEAPDGFCVEGRSHADGVAACWSHRDRVVVEAVRNGVQAWGMETIDSLAGNELKARGIEMVMKLGCEACGILLDECGRCKDIRALVEKVRRGDA